MGIVAGGWFLISMICKKVNVYLSFGTERKSQEGFKGTLHLSTYETILYSHPAGGKQQKQRHDKLTIQNELQAPGTCTFFSF